MQNVVVSRNYFHSILNHLCSPFLEGGKATLPPSGGKVALPPSNSKYLRIFSLFLIISDWIQNGINLRIYYLL